MSRLAWVAVLALALALRAVGLGFGLPDREHAYPYNPDEWTPMQALQRMEPRRLDFNPHYFDNPTLFYYMIGGTAFAAGRAGWVRVDGDERFYFDHPEHLWRILALGRGLAVVFGVATVWLTYRLAGALGLGRGASALASVLLAVHPSHVIHSHFMTVNTAVTFWTTAAMILVVRWLRRGDAGAAAAAGAVAGLALSTKYTAALLLPLLVAAGVARGVALARGEGGRGAAPARAAAETAAALAAAAVAFAAGSPYVVLAFAEFRGQLAPFLHDMQSGGGAPWARAIADMARRGLSVHAAASTPALAIAALGGAIVVARRGGTAARLVLAWLAVFVVAALRIPHLASDSRFLPAFPMIAVLGAAAVAALAERRPRLGLATGAALVAGTLGWTLLLLARFVGPLPQQEASRWAREHVGAGERVLLTGTAVYWGPDLPVREYLQPRNAANYARSTDWVFVAPDSFTMPYAEARARRPDVVFLTQWLPTNPRGGEWLADPDYRVVATFPGKVRPFGRRLHVPLDLYDVDVWVLRPASDAAGRAR